jgi:NAD(P)-dependent dehydrogenase (short-subunit alcohol dehydrogenase family)
MMALKDGLAGRVAIVTGALGRLGPVWSSTLAAADMTVVGIDVRPPSTNETVRIEVADVRDRTALERVRDLVLREYGAPAVLVNNAGIDFVPEPGVRENDVVFQQTVDVNLVGVYNTTEVFGGPMCDAGYGSIVNIGSLYAAVAPDPAFYDHFDPPFVKPSAYGASKAGVISLTRYFARLWGRYGVRVNALSPAGVSAGQDDEFRRKYSARIPLGRMAEPDDLRGPLLFLASNASSYVTGHELRVNGGFTA